jgi:hypothetical protein
LSAVGVHLSIPCAVGEFEAILSRFEPVHSDSSSSTRDSPPLKPISAVSATHRTSVPSSSGWRLRRSTSRSGIQ